LVLLKTLIFENFRPPDTKPRKQADLWFSKLVLETDSQQLALASGIEKPLSVL